MNRADQASEPSMEEILASIRLIISDDAKRPVERDEIAAGRPPAPGRDDDHAALQPEEEVLDLTEELVFPVEQPAPGAPPAIAAHAASAPEAEVEVAMEEEHVAEVHEVQAEVHEPSPQPAVAEAAPWEPAPQPAVAEAAPWEPTPQPAVAEAAPWEHAPQPDLQPRQEAAPEPRQDPPYRASPFSARPVWSRRELPGSAQPTASASPREPARQPQRKWAEDIQMPIGDQGPVSLIPSGETQAPVREPVMEAIEAGAEAEQVLAEAPFETLGEKEVAAVAALTESLARSAAGAMGEEELATAGDVDFARLDEERKAEVAESFANAIERESVSRDRSPLPTLLEEVFRQESAGEHGEIAELIADRMEFAAAAESPRRRRPPKRRILRRSRMSMPKRNITRTTGCS